MESLANELQNSEAFKAISAKAQASLLRLVKQADADGRVSLHAVLAEYGKLRKAKKEPTEESRARGQYGYVKLTDTEYNRLITEYGEARVRRMIDHLDERAHLTQNRNGYKDWNSTIRVYFNNGWGPRGGQQAAPRQQVQAAYPAKPVSRALRPPQRTYSAEDLKHIGVNLLD